MKKWPDVCTLAATEFILRWLCEIKFLICLNCILPNLLFSSLFLNVEETNYNYLEKLINYFYKISKTGIYIYIFSYRFYFFCILERTVMSRLPSLHLQSCISNFFSFFFFDLTYNPITYNPVHKETLTKRR